MTTQKTERRVLPDNEKARVHRFNVVGHQGIITVSLYEDGTPGEIQIQMLREGGFVQGLLDAMCLAVSLVLQYGAPVNEVMTQFEGLDFHPAGFTSNPDIKMAKSIPDYVAQWFEHEFPSCYIDGAVGDSVRAPGDGPPCFNCESPMVREGNGWHCAKCNVTTALG